MRSYRRGIQWQRSQTWRWQDRAGVTRTPTRHAERRATSVPFLRWIDRLWLERKIRARHLASQRWGGSVQTIICRVFGSQCQEALYIAYRESRYSIHAVNGQYLGLFQMGSGERSAYATAGYATAYEQTVAAHNLYRARGWEPWTCCEG
jgi:hypothetical protein